MRLYFFPAACSLADHIALIETGLPYELVAIDRKKQTNDGRDYLTINPRGFVPSLQMEDDTILTENLTILAYIADRSGRLLPQGEFGRWRALEAISYMATTVHGGLIPFFKGRPETETDAAREALIKAFGFLDEQLGDQSFLLGPTMTIADPYLFWTLLAAERFGIDTSTRLRAFHERMLREPSVIRALEEEGMLSDK